jgi:hypothetical protein
MMNTTSLLKVLGSVVLLLLLSSILQFCQLHVTSGKVVRESSEMDKRMSVPIPWNDAITTVLPTLSSIDNATQLTSIIKQKRSDQHNNNNNNNNDNNYSAAALSTNVTSVVAGMIHHHHTHNKTLHPVVIRPEEAFMWKGAQSRLCKRIKREQKKHEEHTTKRNATIHLFLQLSCEKIHEQNQHGNFLLGFYGMKLAALYFDVDFTLQCSEGMTDELSSLDRKRDYLFWWLQTRRKESWDDLQTTGRPVVEYINNNNIDNYSLMNETLLYDPPHPPEKSACTVSFL